MTKIDSLKDGDKRVDVEAMVVGVGQSRTVNLKAGGTSEVADIIISDETGEITLTLWNEEIEKVAAGAKVRIENGYINSYNGKLKLNVGKYGALVVE